MGFEKTVNLKIQEEFTDEGRDYQQDWSGSMELSMLMWTQGKMPC